MSVFKNRHTSIFDLKYWWYR